MKQNWHRLFTYMCPRIIGNSIPETIWVLDKKSKNPSSPWILRVQREPWDCTAMAEQQDFFFQGSSTSVSRLYSASLTWERLGRPAVQETHPVQFQSCRWMFSFPWNFLPLTTESRLSGTASYLHKIVVLLPFQAGTTLLKIFRKIPPLIFCLLILNSILPQIIGLWFFLKKILCSWKPMY